MIDARRVALDEWRSACAGLLADGFDYFDVLTAAEAVDSSGVVVTLHVGRVDLPFAHCFIETQVAYEAALPSICDIYAGAAWHEREIHEMFGVNVEGHPDLRALLLDGVGAQPLRKSNYLVVRAQTPWPGRDGRKKPLGVPEELR